MGCEMLEMVTSELQEAATKVDEQQVADFVDAVVAANRIFVAGAGRSGFAARAFANRLLHIGKVVSFVGEPTTPPIAKGDLLVIGSGSGKTAGLVVMAQKALDAGADIATVTIAPENTIGQMAKTYIKLPGTTRLAMDADADSVKSNQVAGNLFEQMSWLTYDTVVMLAKEKMGVTQDEMITRHANLE